MHVVAKREAWGIATSRGSEEWRYKAEEEERVEVVRAGGAAIIR